MAAVNDGRMFDTPFNVVAGFRSRAQAETAARRLSSAGLPEVTVEVGARPDAGGPVETAELRAEMQSELNRNWGMVTGRQARGALVGTGSLALAGLIVGGVIGLILALGLSMSLSGTIVIGAIIGLMAGGTIGFVAGGGAASRTGGGIAGTGEFDDPAPVGERDVLLAVHAAAAGTAERAAQILRDDLHADRVDLVDASGTPLPPEHDHPRPADPEGYWWNQAGKG
jgi:hypothetical protein